MSNRKLAPIEIPEESPIDHRISWWLENTFTRVFKYWFNAAQEGMRKVLRYALGDWFDDMEIGLRDIMEPYIDYMLTVEEIPNSLKRILTKAKAGESQVELVVLALIVPVAMSVFSYAFNQSIGELAAQSMRNLTRPTKLDPFSVLEMFNRGLISERELRQQLSYGGWPDLTIDKFLEMRHPHWDVGILREGHRRGTISEEQVYHQLGQMGFDDIFIRAWLDQTYRIPSPAELVGIATREGFDANVAAKFGYDDNFPTEAAEWGEKQGLDREWFIKLWRAHWRLPGVAQGFEMFHRRILSREELELLLRVSDIPSFWRDALIQLSYSVVTRVDVRRMYSLGVYNETDVYRKNLDLGYSPTDAKDLTDWIIASYAEKERNLTKSDILGMYRDGILNEGETTGFLRALDYKESDIILLIARQDLARQAEYETTVKKEVRLGYLAGIYDRTQAFGLLSQLDPPAGYIENAVTLWDLEKRRRVKKPTVTNLRDFWLNDVIDDAEIRQELVNLGYTDKYVDLFMSFWLIKFAGGE